MQTHAKKRFHSRPTVWLVALLSSFGVSALALAGEPQRAPVEPVRASNARAHPSSSSGSAPVASSSNWELYQNVVINAGSSVSIDSGLSFATYEHVAVSVRCTAATTSATSMSGIVLQPLWSVPGAELFSIAEFALGSKFAYWDAGGAVFQVYGPQFRLTIENTGSSAITLDQVVIFAPTEAPAASESSPSARRGVVTH
jgi:hypothetical protein